MNIAPRDWPPEVDLHPDYVRARDAQEAAFIFQQANRCRPTTSHHIRFREATRRQAAHWQHVYGWADREVYKASAKYNSSGRPGTYHPAFNGYTLFVGVAFATRFFDTAQAAVQDTGDTGVLLSFTFDAAHAATQTLSFTVQYDAQQPPSVRDAFFIFHRRPGSQLLSNPYRYTRLAAAWQPQPDNTDPQPFAVPARYPFTAGQTVRVLARHHRSTAGVDNYALYTVAT